MYLDHYGLRLISVIILAVLLLLVFNNVFSRRAAGDCNCGSSPPTSSSSTGTNSSDDQASPGRTKSDLARDVAEKFDIPFQEAKRLIEELGMSRVNNAADLADTHSQFYLYAQGPKREWSLKKGCLYLKLLHPRTGEALTDLQKSPSITLGNKKTNSIDLFGGMKFNPDRKAFVFCFNQSRWIIPPSGQNYIMTIDLMDVLHITREVRVDSQGRLTALVERQ